MTLFELSSLFQCPVQEHQEVTGFSIDSRQINPGELFIALVGERFDGHQFMADAVKKGAIAVLCSERNPDLAVPQFVVPDTLHALTELALYHREQLKVPTIAVTGSNGKTTVKEMIAAILPKPSHATRGNFNNHIGAPLSVLRLNKAHQYAVFELGANHIGEIKHTVNIVKPQVSLINNIGPAHLEGFGSIDGVAKAKGEIYQGLSSEGIAVVNADDAYAHFWDDILQNKRVVRFSMEQPTDVYASHLTYDKDNRGQFVLHTPIGQTEIILRVPGRHHVQNALAAAACCYAIGLPLKTIATGLHQFAGVSGRLTHLPGKHQSLVIDDSYNANLGSVLTAIDVLAKRPGRRVLVLGDMGELGSASQAHHEEVGRAAKRCGIDFMLACGPKSLFAVQAFGEKGRHYASQQELATDLLTKLDADTTVLVKGSRSAAMENIVQQIVLNPEPIH